MEPTSPTATEVELAELKAAVASLRKQVATLLSERADLPATFSICAAAKRLHIDSQRLRSAIRRHQVATIPWGTRQRITRAELERVESEGFNFRRRPASRSSPDGGPRRRRYTGGPGLDRPVRTIAELAAAAGVKLT